MYSIGDKITDPAGQQWRIVQMWEFEGDLCLAMVDDTGLKMGGVRLQARGEVSTSV